MYALLLAMTQITSPSVSVGVQAIHELAVESCYIPISLPPSSPSLTCQSTYAITTNGNYKKIVGSLDHSLPSPLVLTVVLQAPRGAKSEGKVQLTTQETVLVSNISRIAQANLNITYTFFSSEPIVSGIYPGQVRFTLID